MVPPFRFIITPVALSKSSTLRKPAIALGVDSDTLVFGPDERGPHNELKLKFEAVEAMSPEDQAVIISLIDAYIKKRRLEELAAS